MADKECDAPSYQRVSAATKSAFVGSVSVQLTATMWRR
jgi:hypothetical protein